MSAPGSLAVESASGSHSVGPWFEPGDERCVACFLRRRAESATACGTVRLVGPDEMRGLAVGPDDVRPDHQVEPDGAAHRFLPYPSCRCPRAERLGTTGGLPVTDLVSARTGVVTSLRVLRATAPTQVLAVGARTTGSGGCTVVSDGVGVDDDPVLAGLKAIGEASERYAAGFWDHSPATTVDTSDGRALVPAVDVDDGSVRAVPADAVFMPFPSGRHEQSSVGLASGRSLAAAANRAVAERIERDVLWRCLGEGCGNGEVRRGGDRTVDVLVHGPRGHDVVCVLRRTPEPPFLTFGLGCSPDAEEARVKAHTEEHHVRACLTRAAEVPTSAPSSPLDRLLLRVALDADAADRVLATLTTTNGAPPSTAAFGVVDLTTQDLLACGLYVARAVPLRAT